MSIRFVLALVENEVLSAEQFVELATARVASQLPLATLALRSNLLTIRQVRDVLQESETRQISFVQAALATEMLRPSQIHTLTVQQEASALDWLEMVIELEMLTDSQVRSLQQACFPNESLERPFVPPQPKFARERIGEPVHSSR